MATEYWQLATEKEFAKYDIVIEECDKLKQEGMYNGMCYRRLTYANGHMKDMWQDMTMKPITRSQLDMILANEPKEV